MPEDNLQQPKSKKWLWILTFIFLALGAIWIGWWMIWGRFRETTEDAYVNGNKVMVTPQTTGIVASIHADDTMFVQQGQVLVQLDPTDTLIQLGVRKALLGSTLRSVAELFIKTEELKAEREVREADLIRATLDYDHRKALVDSGAVSLEDFQHAETTLMSAHGNLMVIENQLREAEAQVFNTTPDMHPQVMEAKNRLRDAWVNWKRTTIKAPVTGVVAQRRVQVGQWILPGAPLLAVIPMEQMWVDANFKEEQLRHMHIGQTATLTADLYGGGIVYHGHVIGMAAGTGAVFSTLPPQNATGNWIKIVQRVPVRIAIDPKELLDHPLRLGLSMDVAVNLHDQKGPLIPKGTPLPPLYTTEVFLTEEDGVDEAIAAIIQETLDVATLEGVVGGT